MPEMHPAIQMLHVEVDDNDESYFRFLCHDKQVKYVTIEGGIFSADDMCFAPALLPMLPPFPPGDWNYGRIAKSPQDGTAYFTETVRKQLSGVQNVWHPTRVDHLDLIYGHRLRSNIWEATTPALPTKFVTKFARFDWEIGYMDDECAAYQWIEGQSIGPKFLGHLVEEGRVIGFLIESLVGSRHAEIGDLTVCQEALTRLHKLGIKHGDVNKFNFMIRGGHATLIDFECARKCDDKEELEEELRSLATQLVDNSGRGGRGLVDTGS
jgi:hypothetical protein